MSKSESAIKAVAKRLQALGDPLRLQLLYLLRGGEQSVGELAAASGSSQPNISRHLARLYESGMLHRRQEGNQVFYSVADEIVFEICDRLCDKIRDDLGARLDDIG